MNKLMYVAGFLGIYASCLADISEGGIANATKFKAHLTITANCSNQHKSIYTQEIAANGFYELDVNSGCSLRITGYLVNGNTQINLPDTQRTIYGERYKVTIQPKASGYEVVAANY